MNEVMEIRTGADFAEFRRLCGKDREPIDAKLMNDIDFVNCYFGAPFFLKGTLDGQGYTIKGVRNRLFSSVGKTGVIKNLTVTGNLQSGAPFCWYNCGTIENCVNKVDTELGAGFCDTLKKGGKLVNCRNEGKIKGDIDYVDFASLDFDTDKLQFVNRINKRTVYENNTAAGSFETKLGCAVPVEILVKSALRYSDFLPGDKIRRVLESVIPSTDRWDNTWLHQFIKKIKEKNCFSSLFWIPKEAHLSYFSSIIENIALLTDIDFAAKNKKDKTAIDYLYKKDEKIFPKAMPLKKLISNIAKDQQRNKIADTQEINDWGIER